MKLKFRKMATDSKLHKEYRETQKGMNTGLTYSGWLEDRVNELREQVKLFDLPDVVKSDCKHPISYRARDNKFNLVCSQCGKIL